MKPYLRSLPNTPISFAFRQSPAVSGAHRVSKVQSFGVGLGEIQGSGLEIIWFCYFLRILWDFRRFYDIFVEKLVEFMWICVDLIWIIGFLAHNAGGFTTNILARKTGKLARRIQTPCFPQGPQFMVSGTLKKQMIHMSQSWKGKSTGNVDIWCEQPQVPVDVLFDQPNDLTKPFDVNNNPESLPWKPTIKPESLKTNYSCFSSQDLMKQTKFQKPRPEADLLSLCWWAYSKKGWKLRLANATMVQFDLRAWSRVAMKLD